MTSARVEEKVNEQINPDRPRPTRSPIRRRPRRPRPDLTDGEHPPYAVAALSAALGLASLYFIGKAWRGSRAALRPLIAMRILSALTAVPGLFGGGVPVAAFTAAAAIVAVTAVSVFLVVRTGMTKPVTE